MRCRRESAYTAQDLVGRGRAAGLQPVQLFVDEVNVRAWPGGVGDNKVGSNYAPVIPTQAAAFRQHGTQQARRARAPCPQPRCGGGGSGCLGRATPAFAADRPASSWRLPACMRLGQRCLASARPRLGAGALRGLQRNSQHNALVSWNQAGRCACRSCTRCGKAGTTPMTRCSPSRAP